MAKKRRGYRRVKPIPLTIGQDPSLWRFESLSHALAASTDHLVELIRAAQTPPLEEEAATDQRDPDNDAVQLAAR